MKWLLRALPLIPSAFMAIVMLGFVVPALAAAKTASTYACVTSAQFGQCFSGSNPVVNNNVWGLNGNYRGQTLSAYTGWKWDVTSNVAAGNHSVVSYPETVSTAYTNGKDTPLSGLASLNSSWSTALPASPGSSDSYEFAYDIWLNGNYASANSQEIMVWTNVHHTQPAGSNTGATFTDPSTGVKYQVWAGNGNKVVSLVGPNRPSGAVNLLALLKYVSTSPYNFHGDNALDNIDYGAEILSTSGNAETFHVALGLTHTRV